MGGAGTSTDSGIKDFRSSNGLYNEKYKYSPEFMLSSKCFYNLTEEFYDFYKNKMNCLNARPNNIHKFLKKLEDLGKIKAIITQNIDGLHQKVGSYNVYELHGSVHDNYCLNCNKYYDAKYVFKFEGIPRCNICNGIIKPSVVLYGEALPNDQYFASIKAISLADMLIVAGTSLTVQPASSLVKLFKGKYLVIINNDKTSYDNIANLVINENISSVFNKLKI